MNTLNLTMFVIFLNNTSGQSWGQKTQVNSFLKWKLGVVNRMVTIRKDRN